MFVVVVVVAIIIIVVIIIVVVFVVNTFLLCVATNDTNHKHMDKSPRACVDRPQCACPCCRFWENKSDPTRRCNMVSYSKSRRPKPDAPQSVFLWFRFFAIKHTAVGHVTTKMPMHDAPDPCPWVAVFMAVKSTVGTSMGKHGAIELPS